MNIITEVVKNKYMNLQLMYALKNDFSSLLTGQNFDEFYKFEHTYIKLPEA